MEIRISPLSLKVIRSISDGYSTITACRIPELEMQNECILSRAQYHCCDQSLFGIVSTFSHSRLIYALKVSAYFTYLLSRPQNTSTRQHHLRTGKADMRYS